MKSVLGKSRQSGLWIVWFQGTIGSSHYSFEAARSYLSRRLSELSLHQQSKEPSLTWQGSANVQAATRSFEGQRSSAEQTTNERTTRSAAATIAPRNSQPRELSSGSIAHASVRTVTAAANRSAAGLSEVASYPEPFRTWASRNLLGRCAACDRELSYLGSFRDGLETHGKAGRIHSCGIFCHNLVCVKFARFVNQAMQVVEAQI